MFQWNLEKLFGSAAIEALERTVQARKTRQQLSVLQRSVPPPSRPRGSSAAPQHSSHPQAHPYGYLRSQRPHPQPAQQQAQAFRAPEQQPSGQPQVSYSALRSPRAFREAGGPGAEGAHHRQFLRFAFQGRRFQLRVLTTEGSPAGSQTAVGSPFLARENMVSTAAQALQQFTTAPS